MGINKKGVGAALMTIGAGIREGKRAEEEKRRHEVASAREERRLQIAEEDAIQRREMNELKIGMEKAKWSNQQLSKAFVTSQYEPAAVGAALSANGDGVTRYDFSTGDSPKNEDGSYQKIVYRVGTNIPKGAGVSGQGGVPTTQYFPGGTGYLEFVTDENGTAQEKLVSWTSDYLNPDKAISRQMFKKDAVAQQQAAKEAHEYAIKNNPAYAAKHASAEEMAKLSKEKAGADIEKTKAQTEKAKAETARLKREPSPDADKGGSIIKGFKGEDVRISKEKSQTLRAALPGVARKYNDVNTDNDVWKIDQVRNNKTIRDKMNNQIAKVLDGTMSDAELVQASRDELGLSGEFVQELIDIARANKEDWEEDIASKTPNLLQSTVNKIMGTSFGTGG